MEAVPRCKEVNEDRLLALIGVAGLTTSAGEEDKARQISQLLQIAEGYFLRAASFQPDPPQMWKKALDAIVARSTLEQEELFEAVYPLENLIRVAETKGNAKRVTELSLRLSESYLSTPVVMLESDTAVSKAFVQPFRPKKLEPSTTKAGKALKKCEASGLDDEGTLWYQTLAFRIEIETELATIQELANEKLTAANIVGLARAYKPARLLVVKTY
jgi:hypothetical protein